MSTAETHHAFADQVRDPELHAELLFERRRDDVNLTIWRRNGGHEESRPADRTDEDRLRAARRTIAARRERTPAQQFSDTLISGRKLLVDADNLLAKMRISDASKHAAQSAELVALAKRLGQLALDAAVLADAATTHDEGCEACADTGATAGYGAGHVEACPCTGAA